MYNNKLQLLQPERRVNRIRIPETCFFRRDVGAHIVLDRSTVVRRLLDKTQGRSGADWDVVSRQMPSASDHTCIRIRRRASRR